jgi:hypothetical protein
MRCARCQARKKFLLKLNGRLQVSQEISIPKITAVAGAVLIADKAGPSNFNRKIEYVQAWVV